MATISNYMTSEHEHCDDLFAAAENAAAAGDLDGARAQYDAFRQATLTHFMREESVLFPAFDERTGMVGGPTSMMCLEHAQMRETLAAMDQALARGDAQAFLGLAEGLLLIMRQHNLKEEQILYPMTDQALSDESDTLLRQMEAVQRLNDSHGP